MKVYWHLGPLRSSELYDQLGVFAGETNCAIQECDFVKAPVVNGYNVFRLFWYIYKNPFTDSHSVVPEEVLFPLTGLDAPGYGLDGPNGPMACGTDGIGSISVMMSPRTVYEGLDGSCVACIAQYDFDPPVKPWVDGNALQMAFAAQQFTANVAYHDGTVGGDGGIYWYGCVNLIGPNGYTIMICAKVYQDKYFPVTEMSDVTDAVVPYYNGALLSCKLGESLLLANTGQGGFAMKPATYTNYVFVIDRYRLEAIVALVNSVMHVALPTDYRQWSVNQVALDIESVATGENNPQLGMSFNRIELAAI